MNFTDAILEAKELEDRKTFLLIELGEIEKKLEICQAVINPVQKHRKKNLQKSVVAKNVRQVMAGKNIRREKWDTRTILNIKKQAKIFGIR